MTLNKIDEYKNKINYDVWEDIYNMGSDEMREDRTSYIVRKMQESRMETSPEEAKIYRARNLDNKLSLQQQNALLRNNVKELQGQLQDAYKRIAELRTTIDLAVEIQKENQLELDFDTFYKEKKWKNADI